MEFLAASDEASGERIFHHAGYVAPLACWTEVLIPAWREKVLKGPPLLDEFHMTEVRSPSWREKLGITKDDAEARIDAAVEVISQTPGLFAIRSSVDGAHFEKHASGLKFRLNDPLRKPAGFVIDYPSFNGYMYLVLLTCAAYSKTEKVNFMIEKKKEVFPAIDEFFVGLRQSFVNIGWPRCAEIMGTLLPGDKKAIPLQTADVLCWHTQRLAAHVRNSSISFSDVDSARFSKLTRLGSGHTWPREMMQELCDGLFDDWRKLNEVEGISKIQSSEEERPSCAPESSKNGD